MSNEGSVLAMRTGNHLLLARREKVKRIGMQRLWECRVHEDCWYVSIDNRTYHSLQPIPVTSVPRWMEKLS